MWLIVECDVRGADCRAAGCPGLGVGEFGSLAVLCGKKSNPDVSDKEVTRMYMVRK